MANRYLLPLYKYLFEKEFDCQPSEMQASIYLLQSMGVPVGDYGFRWCQCGPYSQDLQDDIPYESELRGTEVQLSKEHAKTIEQLRAVINDSSRGEYSISDWVECLASLYYLRENIVSFSASREDVVAELENRKPHLSSREINLNAYNLVEGLYK